MATPGLDPIEFRLEPGKVSSRPGDRHRRQTDSRGLRDHPELRPAQGIFLRTWTDLDGRFRWDSAPSRNVVLSISKDGDMGIQGAHFTADNVEKTVVLRPGLRVTIIARDARTGEAVERFRVTAGKVDADTGAFVSDQGQFSVVTEGEYQVTLDATAGPYQFQVSSEGYEPATSTMLKGDEKEVKEVIKLEKAAVKP